MEGTQVWSLVQEDPTGSEQLSPQGTTRESVCRQDPTGRNEDLMQPKKERKCTGFLCLWKLKKKNYFLGQKEIHDKSGAFTNLEKRNTSPVK